MNSKSSSSLLRHLLAAALALALPLAAVAERGMPPGGCDGMGHLGRPGAEMLPPNLRGLALSEAQRDKLFELLHAQAPAMRERAIASRKAEGELQALAFATDFSEARAKSALEAAGRAQGEMAAARLRLDRQVAELLTPEQRRQLQERRPPREACDGMPPARG